LVDFLLFLFNPFLFHPSSNTLLVLEGMTSLSKLISAQQRFSVSSLPLNESWLERQRPVTGGALSNEWIGVKANLCVRDHVTHAGSRVLEAFVSPFDATVVRRVRDAGARLVPGLNMDEFGMGGSTTTSAVGSRPLPTRNPHDTARIAGGSSGGCAALVASGAVLGALASDTGGSVRQPAVYCRVFGLKPSYGRLSRHGLIAYASSLDTVGLLARDVASLRRLFDVTAGADELDETSADAPPVPRDDGAAPLRVGIPLEYRPTELDDELASEWQRAAAFLASACGASVRSVSLPSTRVALPAYYVIASSEASSNLARYDGVRYGRGRECFGDEVRRRILLGTLALSRGSFDQYYGQALRVRRRVHDEFAAALREFDCLLAPCVTSRTPPTLAEVQRQDPLDAYAQDVLTVGANLAGLPALALPNGLQLIGRWGEEERLFRVAEKLVDQQR
jgi:aspartyl-tRNA(Asn)/glutamyl-tRNA(Gln) amidotransferase subunit A